MSSRKFEVCIYTACITQTSIYIRGRLLKSNPLKSRISDGYFLSMTKSILRAWNKEIKNLAFNIEFNKQIFVLESDDDGYFELHKDVQIPDDKLQYIFISFNTGHEPIKQQLTSYRDPGVVGLITDIDDTILETKVKSRFKLKMIANTIFINPFRRKVIKGASSFYRQIIEKNSEQIPVIYISNSPWNLHDYLKDFLKYNKFPYGEIVLRDFGLHMLQNESTIEEQNKYIELEKTLTLFRETNFILVGDSAESDFDLYHKLFTKHPERILQVIIIQAGNHKNEERIRREIQERKLARFELIDNYKNLSTKSSELNE